MRDGQGQGISLRDNISDIAKMLSSNIAESDFEDVANAWLPEAMCLDVTRQNYVDVPEYIIASGAKEKAKYQEALEVSALEALEMFKQAVREAHKETRKLVREPRQTQGTSTCSRRTRQPP